MKKLGIVLLALLVLFSFAVTALAVDFTPSVERKDAPTLVPLIDSAGNGCDAVIRDEDGNKTSINANTNLRLVITPDSEKENAILEDITRMLDDAKAQIKKADNVENLTPKMVSALQELSANTSDPVLRELEIKDLIVCDLFDVSLVRDGIKLEELAEGQTITFSLQTDFTKDDVLFVLHNISGETWEVVKTTTLDENGVLTITLDSLSPLAFVTYRLPEKPLDPNAPTSPQTGEASGALTGAVLFGAAALLLFACALFARKKQTQK